MKIKVHQLASELNISDQALLHWLARYGYPQAASQSWLSGQLAYNARSHFMSFYPNKNYLPPQVELSHSPSGSHHTTDPSSQINTATHTHESPSLKSLYDAERAHNIQLQKYLHQMQQHVQKHNASAISSSNEISHASPHHTSQTWLNERTQYRQKIQDLIKNQATLDQTCAELTLELEQMKTEVDQLQQQLQAQAQINRSLTQVSQQKKAWQARALELEEQVHSGQNLSTQLKELGLTSFEKQTLLFQTLLQTPESAAQLFNTIKMVDRTAVDEMVNYWVVPTCAHPLCNQTNQLSNRLSLRVDDPSRCAVCHGDEARRWFSRMIACCERLHIKRFLMVGADRIHNKIRSLTEGKSIEFRLISEGEQSSKARIQSRLESCDVLVLWSPRVVEAHVSQAYYELAHITQRSVLKLNGDRVDLTVLAQQILYWLSRNAGQSLLY